MESAAFKKGPIGWLMRHKERIGLIAVGHTAKKVEEFLFDWLVYGAVVVWTTSTWGLLWGSIVAFFIMAPFSALVCFLYIRMYDWAKKDLFGFELVKELRDEERHDHWLGRLLHRMARLGNIPAFIILSLHSDPFFTTVYLRHKTTQYSGLSRRDWMIFWGSVLFSNGYWTLRWTVIVVIVQFIWNWLKVTFV